MTEGAIKLTPGTMYGSLSKMEKDNVIRFVREEEKRKIYHGMYYFEKCVPQDVVYQLDYNKEGLEHKDEYLKMFDDCGWEYLQDYAGYSYFRKAV